MSLVEAFLPMATQKTAAWLAEIREKHLPGARALLPAELAAFRDYFEPELLDSVRIKEVQEIEKPKFYDGLKSQLAFVGIRIHFDFANTDGLTSGNCILIRGGRLNKGLLFHEMVHVEQYRQLGMERFARAYIAGLAENGFVYEETPLEAIGFSLSQRFGGGEQFVVRKEVAALIARKGY